MTKEEEVEVLKERYLTCVGIGLDNHANRVNEALDLAISVLSTPSGDLISRADAMAEFRECVKRANENGETPTWNDAVSLIGSLPSAKQVASKLNNPCNSLLTEESNGSKEHKSKLDLISRQDVIEALCRSSVYAWSIEQDQTAHDWALNIIKALPSAKGGDAQMNEVNPKQYMQQSPNGADLISRQDAINTLETEERNTDRAEDVSGLTLAKFLIDALPSAEAEWIPFRDDLLIRENAAEVVGEFFNKMDISLFGRTGVRLARNVLNSVPTVAPLKWIPLNKDGHEPLFEGDYLLCLDDGYIASVYFDGSDWELWADSGEPVAWMPLPKPYGEDGEA